MLEENKMNAMRELSLDEMDKVSGGTQASNLIFTGKSVKAVKTVQKGEAPKAGNLVHKVVTGSGQTKVLTEKEGLDGILLSGDGGSDYC